MLKTSEVKYKLSVKKFGEVQEDELCSVDPEWTLQDVVSLAVAHNSGALNAEDNVYIGSREEYCYVPETAPALIWTPVTKKKVKK